MTKSIFLTFILMTFGIIPSIAASVSEPDATSCAQAYVLNKLRTHVLVFMGITHKQPPILVLLADLLPHLHAVGVTHVALEIASDQQQRINRFLMSGDGLDDIVLHAAIDCRQYRHLFDIFRALAPCARPQVRAVDLPPAAYDAPQDRDQWMADRLTAIFQSRRKAKVLAVMGSLHVLRDLKWPQHTHLDARSIRRRLCDLRPELSVYSIINIVGAAERSCDFGRTFGPLPGRVALDLDERFTGWRLGLTRCIAIAPAEPYELADGVIVY